MFDHRPIANNQDDSLLDAVGIGFVLLLGVAIGIFLFIIFK